jgi:hypothetical protein
MQSKPAKDLLDVGFKSKHLSLSHMSHTSLDMRQSTNNAPIAATLMYLDKFVGRKFVSLTKAGCSSRPT